MSLNGGRADLSVAQPMSNSLARALLLSLLALLAALILSVAIGPVYIPPRRDPCRAGRQAERRRAVERCLPDVLHHPARDPSAACAAAPADRRGAGRKRRRLSGPVPQPAGRPIPDRRGLGRGAGRGHRHEHPLAGGPGGAVCHSGGGLCGRLDHRDDRLQPGAHRKEPADDDPDPGGRGHQLVCHLADLVPDAALQRGTAPGNGLAAGRLADERLAAGDRLAALRLRRTGRAAGIRARAERAAIRRGAGQPDGAARGARQVLADPGGLA